MWTPDELNLSLWLDASDSDNFIIESGHIAQWNDKSTNANHLTQSEIDKRLSMVYIDCTRDLRIQSSNSS